MITALKYEVADIVKKATPEELELIIHTLYLEVERYKHAFQRAEALIDCYEYEFGTPKCIHTEHALYVEASRNC